VLQPLIHANRSTPISPPSGPVTGSFKGLHLKSNFLAITGMMGEIVGKAAWICVRHQSLPRGVYESHLPLLKELMEQPGAARRDSLDGKLSQP
jgi:hypothetical protein